MPHAPRHKISFFARIKTFDISCPGCGEVYSVKAHRHPRRTKVWSGWDPRTSRYRCWNCRRVFILGVLAWPMPGTGSGCPPDAIPSLAQAQALRTLTASLLESRRALAGHPANRLESAPPDSVWRGLPEGVDLEDFLNGRWEPPKKG